MPNAQTTAIRFDSESKDEAMGVPGPCGSKKAAAPVRGNDPQCAAVHDSDTTGLFHSNDDIRRYAATVCTGSESAGKLALSLESGADPLGDAYMNCNTAETRRSSGSTYTPFMIVDEMVEMARREIRPSLIVDCGCGSGRYALACARRFPYSRVLAVDSSHDAIAMCKANVIAAGLSSRVDVVQADFTDYTVDRPADGPVLWIGNPPYVRHHDIDEAAKTRFKTIAKDMGLQASGLAGLHMHFLASIARQWRQGDYGVLVTSAEWMDVNYGSFARRLLAGNLGLDELRLFDKTNQVFDTADTTAVIMAFGHGSGEVLVRLPDGTDRRIPVGMLSGNARWTRLVEHGDADDTRNPAQDMVPLGSLARVHRGVVTGDNAFWVRRPDDLDGIPDTLTVPVIAHAREITGECMAQSSPESLGRLIVIPEDTGELDPASYEAARDIIAQGESRGVDAGYVARHRRKWWSIRPPQPPAILMTYMGRGKPTFVVNRRRLPMLNVVHGLYPRVDMTPKALDRLAAFLNESVDTAGGRTYCGGLVKFEPREAEAIMVPALEKLES